MVLCARAKCINSWQLCCRKRLTFFRYVFAHETRTKWRKYFCVCVHVEKHNPECVQMIRRRCRRSLEDTCNAIELLLGSGWMVESGWLVQMRPPVFRVPRPQVIMRIVLVGVSVCLFVLYAVWDGKRMLFGWKDAKASRVCVCVF